MDECGKCVECMCSYEYPPEDGGLSCDNELAPLFHTSVGYASGCKDQFLRRPDGVS